MTPTPAAVARIVAPTDFSPAAEAGVAWARALAELHGATLHLIHAVPPMPLVPADVPLPVDLADQVVAAAAERLEAMAGEWRARGLAVETWCAIGSPASLILERAAAVEADAVVLGTRGHTGLRYVLLGSTSRRVVQRCRCPVLAVHPEQGAKRLPPATVLVPTDLTEDLEALVGSLERLLKPDPGRTRIVLFHAWQTPVEYTTYGTAPAIRMEDRPFIATGFRQRLEEVAAPLRQRGLLVDVKVVEAFPTHAVVDEARAVGADLIVMGTHGVTGWEHLVLGSVAERVVQTAPCPVLTLRLADRPEAGG